jgi:hypothetical protein
LSLLSPAAAWNKLSVKIAIAGSRKIDAFAALDREAAVVAAETAELLNDFHRRLRQFEIVASEGLSFARIFFEEHHNIFP